MSISNTGGIFFSIAAGAARATDNDLVTIMGADKEPIAARQLFFHGADLVGIIKQLFH